MIKNLQGEIWMYVTNEAVNGVLPNHYSISNYGRIYSRTINRLMSQTITNQYYMVSLRLTNGGYFKAQIHRLVLLAFDFRTDFEFLQGNHINGNKLDNTLWNLEWVTPSENLLHSYDIGLARVGEANSLSTHYDAQVHMICKCLEQRMKLKDIASFVGLDPEDETNIKFISQIKNKDIWCHISDQYNIQEGRNNQLFTDDQIHYICEFIVEGLSDEDIINRLGINLNKEQYKTTMYNIRSKKRFTRISDLYFKEKLIYTKVQRLSKAKINIID